MNRKSPPHATHSTSSRRGPPRAGGKPYKPIRRPSHTAPASEATADTAAPIPAGRDSDRIAKVIARAGVTSRRDAEAWIEAGRVALNGKVVQSPALNVADTDQITIDGKPLPRRERTRLFLYHKPAGLVTTHADPEKRPTIFEALPEGMPRVISVGRLDLTTEGLLLLTNDGGLARVLELPATAWLRRYRVRAHGEVTQPQLDGLRDGITIDGIRYGAIEAQLDRQQGSNVWLTFAIREGKNREVRNVLRHLNLHVNRLIRVSYGPFQLGELAEGAVEEVKTRILREQLGPRITADSEADFSSPITAPLAAEHAPARPPRFPARPRATEGTAPAAEGKRFGGERPATRTARFGKEQTPERPARSGDAPRSAPDRSGDRKPRFGDKPRGGRDNPKPRFGDKPRGERESTRHKTERTPERNPRFSKEAGPQRHARSGDAPRSARDRSGDRKPRFGDKPRGERETRADHKPRFARSDASDKRPPRDGKPFGEKRYNEKSYGDKTRPTGDKPFAQDKTKPRGGKFDAPKRQSHVFHKNEVHAQRREEGLKERFGGPEMARRARKGRRPYHGKRDR